MQLTVVFEHWHLGDGNYPAFARGDVARLSFELDAVEVIPAHEGPTSLRRIQDAEYACTARVLRTYPDGVDSQFAVFEAETFRFYCPTSVVATLQPGQYVSMRGRLALDHYMWVEFLDRYPDPPNLFYSVRVDRIRQVGIPERFIGRGAGTLTSPASLAPPEYGDEAMREVRQVEELKAGPSFSILDLTVLPDDAGPRKPTFLGA